MKTIKYSRYTGEDFGIDSEDLMKALSDFLLESGFNAQYSRFSEWNKHTLERTGSPRGAHRRTLPAGTADRGRR